ncbi:hypothetical protein KCU62_g305, partial [Aureobasidium sp. EXF-3399]
MTSIITPNEVVASGEIANTFARAPSTLGRPGPVKRVQKGPRVVINKAKNLASLGSRPWDNASRQILVDEHTLHETWEPVAQLLERSNQALRSEWNKMKSGQREKEGNWKEKVEICEAHRKITFSSGSSIRDTTTTAPATNAAATGSVPNGTLLLIKVAESINSGVLLSGGHGGVAGRKVGSPSGKKQGPNKRYPRPAQHGDNMSREMPPGLELSLDAMDQLNNFVPCEG